MSAPLRILITGFGPFPGAPFNPTQRLVRDLVRLRRPAYAGIERIGHIFPVSYAAVDRELPALLARHRPDALLMFGLAARTPWIRVETRARNAITLLWPDAEHAVIRQASIARGMDAQPFGAHTHRLLRAAITTGADVRISRNAGSYLCNYLGWRGIEAAARPGGPAIAAFIHVPLVARDAASLRMPMRNLTRAGEAMLLETLRLARATRLPRPAGN